MKFKDIILFAQEQLKDNIKSVKRGRFKATQYFLIPLKYREMLKGYNYSYNCGIIQGESNKRYLVIELCDEKILKWPRK